MKPHSKGVGLRQEFAAHLCSEPKLDCIDFLELAPENWMGLGGRKRAQLDLIADKYPLVAHGLSLSIADTQPLNRAFIKEVGRFLDEYGIDVYSEHLSFSRDGLGYLCDLLPSPRYAEHIHYLAERIKIVHDLLSRQIVLENISYYYNYPGQISVGDFFAELVEQSGCGILLDINNVYVNSQNHHDDALSSINGMPSSAIVYYHIAGHLKQPDGLLLDTHGTSVIAPVVQLGQQIMALHGEKPLLLERDNNVPPLAELSQELCRIDSAIRESVHAATV